MRAVWVDDPLVCDTPLTYKTAGPSSDLVGGFTNLTLGFFLWEAAPVPFDIYYDDIALDTHRIGPVQKQRKQVKRKRQRPRRISDVSS